jgi:hypothetical protein
LWLCREPQYPKAQRRVLRVDEKWGRYPQTAIRSISRTFDGSVTVPIADFRRQSGLEDDAEWVRDANAWGARQSPKVEFELTQDGTGVVIRKET